MKVTLQELLQDAEARGYGVGMFNFLNLEMARGILEAAQEEQSPLILSVAQVHFPMIPFREAAMIMNCLAEDARVPICLHLDHGTDLSAAAEAVRAGFTSVMFDGSTLPYEENIARTAQVAAMAHPFGVSVEAELGHVGNGDAEQEEGGYTDPAQVNDFIRRSGADALAVAIGTVHGVYRAAPRLDLARLAEIHRVADSPLVLHGGSGLSDGDFRNCIAHGIRKINICTDLCQAANRAYEQEGAFEPKLLLVKDAVKEAAKQKMRLFGSSGKA